LLLKSKQPKIHGLYADRLPYKRYKSTLKILPLPICCCGPHFDVNEKIAAKISTTDTISDSTHSAEISVVSWISDESRVAGIDTL